MESTSLTEENVLSTEKNNYVKPICRIIELVPEAILAQSSTQLYLDGESEVTEPR